LTGKVVKERNAFSPQTLAEGLPVDPGDHSADENAELYFE
jgi:hypothetical protein